MDGIPFGVLVHMLHLQRQRSCPLGHVSKALHVRLQPAYHVSKLFILISQLLFQGLILQQFGNSIIDRTLLVQARESICSWKLAASTLQLLFQQLIFEFQSLIIRVRLQKARHHVGHISSLLVECFALHSLKVCHMVEDFGSLSDAVSCEFLLKSVCFLVVFSDCVADCPDLVRQALVLIPYSLVPCHRQVPLDVGLRHGGILLQLQECSTLLPSQDVCLGPHQCTLLPPEFASGEETSKDGLYFEN